MIPEIAVKGLQYFFLFLLYVFLIVVIRGLYRDLKYPYFQTETRARNKKKFHKPELVVVAADRNIGARYSIEGQVVVGRGPGCNIPIDDTYASQQHARIFKEGDGYFIEDLGSTNGTYVNGRKIAYPLSLRPRDRIKIGKTVFEFRP